MSDQDSRQSPFGIVGRVRIYRSFRLLLLLQAATSQALDPAELLSLNPAITNCIRIPREGTNTATWWSSFVAEGKPAASTNAQSETWEVTLPPETPLGLGVVRIDDERKAGTYRLVLMDPIRTATNRLMDSMMDSSPALPCHPPMAVEGKLEGNATGYLRLNLRAGESVSVEVVAQRLGYPVDSRLRILDTQGRELARADDSTISGLDAALRFCSPQRADYWVELSDVRQPPGSNRRYRLRLGDFPLVPLNWLPFAHIVPGPVNATTLREFTGPSKEWGLELPINGFPVRLQGFARPPGARDVFVFAAGKNQRFRVDIADRRLGSIGDFTARIENARGRVVAEADLSKSELPTLAYTAPAEEIYRLVIEELTGGGGPSYDYVVDLMTGTGDFLLHLNEEILECRPDSSAELKLKIQRRNYDGPLKLSVHGLPAGVLIAGQEVSAKTNDATLTLKLPSDVAPGSWLVGVSGVAEIDGRPCEVRAGTRAALKKHWLELNDPPPALDGLLWLWVGSKPSAE